MKCPGCNAIMVVIELNGVEIDHCFGCGGVWFDSGELNKLLGNDQPVEADMLKKLEKTEEPQRREIKCPICRHKLVQVIWPTIKSEVIIDQCFQGHGLWFDRGELMDIIQFGFSGIHSNLVDLLKNIFSGP
jgi:Zn-finger nucleic acid-binding protein